MPKLAFRLVTLASCLVALGCGPGDIANDGGSFGDGGSGTADDEIGETDSGMSDPNPTTSSSPGTSSEDDAETETETNTDTETGANDWTDPETETDTDEPEPEPIDADCSRVWTHIDTEESHGHIGATPIGPGPDGGFVSVNPVIASLDAVNVDSWVRSWTPSGEPSWDVQLSWGDHRDDPLALLVDDVGDVLLAGRINANTFEDAMIAKLDGASGELLWTILRSEAGGYSSIAYNGAALIVAGMIGNFGEQWLEVRALDPDTGELLWSADPLVDVVATRGLLVADGRVDVLISRASSIEILRYEPPATEAAILATLIANANGLTPFDLEPFGPDRLAALYGSGTASFLAIVDRETGEPIETRVIDEFPGATTVIASELVELPAALPEDRGLGIAGTLVVGAEEQTFVLRLDPELDTVCSGVIGKVDHGFARTKLRGLVVGEDGALYTGSFIDNPTRLGLFARWE